MSHLVVVQWFVVDLCINYESLLTAKEISGRVKEMYWRLPMILWNSDLSTAAVPSTSWRDWVVERGVETSFSLLILMWSKSSRTYLCCERNNHVRVGITSIPKKKMKRTHILERKHVTQLLNNGGHKCGIILYNDKIININREITKIGTVAVNEERGIHFGIVKTQLKNDILECCVPSLWGLFKPIDGLFLTCKHD